MLADYDSNVLAKSTYDTYVGSSWSPMTTTVNYPDVPVTVAIATPRSAFERAAAGAPGNNLAWYVAVCRDGASVGDYCLFAGECQGMAFRAWAPGATPAPRVDPVDLAQSAMDYMELVPPDIDRNPKLADLQQAAVVNLATWFWVTKPEAVGAPSGVRTITAETGGVSATVVATTTGLQLSSPHGDATCSPSASVVSWARGTPESTACTLFFTKASVGYTNGYPVNAKVVWNATWTSTTKASATGQTTGTLNPVTRETTTNIPVAEIQTVVTLR
jgi:hypothetical protein